MQLLSARPIKAARRRHCCTNCDRMISAGSSYLRLYGGADHDVKPWTLRFCERCIVREWPEFTAHRKEDTAIGAALAALKPLFVKETCSNE